MILVRKTSFTTAIFGLKVGIIHNGKTTLLPTPAVAQRRCSDPDFIHRIGAKAGRTIVATT